MYKRFIGNYVFWAITFMSVANTKMEKKYVKLVMNRLAFRLNFNVQIRERKR